MRESLKKLKVKKYVVSAIIVLLLVFVFTLFNMLNPKVKDIKISKVLTNTKTLSASVIDGTNEEITSNNYDEIKYQIKVNKDSSDTAVITATLSDKENKYARFKEISDSVVTNDGKSIAVTTTKNKITLSIIVSNAPYGFTIKPSININSEDSSKSKINVDTVTITGKSVEGKVYSEDGTLFKGIELGLYSNGEVVKKTYTKDNGEYVISLGEVNNYEVKLEETKYKIVRYEDETTDDNRKVLNLVIKEVEPFKVNVKKSISELDLVINGKKEVFNYADETKVVRSIKNAKTIEGSIYYNINIKNDGEVKGTLTVLKDIVPDGLSFNESKNPGWTKEGKYLYYTVIEGTEIEGYGKTSVKLVLDIVKTEEAKNYINTVIASGDDYKYIVYYLNNKVFKEEYVINSEKIEYIDPGVANFDGWYTDRKYTNKYNFNNTVTKDIALYGKLKNNKYSVTFMDKNPNNGNETVLDVKEVEEGNSVDLVDALTYPGYTFKCFELNNSCYDSEEITEDVTLYTKYTVNNYDITYHLDGGTVSTANPTTYTVRDEITLNNPTKEGYTFIGWTGTDLTDKTITVTIPRGSIGNREYTANYSIDSYTLTINPNGGIYNGTSNPTDIPNEYGTVITIDNPERTGYNFTGWTLSGKGTLAGNTYTYSDGDGTLTANYELINYEITYDGLTDAEKTALNNPTSYTVVDEITLTNPSDRLDDDGDVYEAFTGWIYGQSTSINVTIPVGSTGDKHFTANFEHVDPYTYIISYDLDGGSVSTENPTTYTKKTNTFILNNPTKDGYTFTGWSGTDLTGNDNMTVTIPRLSTGNRSYVAHYTPDTYTITYNLDGGTVTGNPETYTIETDTFTLNPPTKEGYTFNGWTGSNGDTPGDVTITKGSKGNKEYTANYTAIEYTINYELNGGAVSTANPTKYTIESNNITLNPPTKNGYNFIGWTGSNGNTPEETVTIPSGSIGEKSYEAHYEPIVYNITYDYDGGSLAPGVTNPATYTIESTEITFNNPSKEGYDFTNYTEGSNVITSIPTGSTGDKSLKANYQIKQYTVSYYNESVLYSTDSVDYNGTTTKPNPDPTKSHNIFLYWSEDGTNEYSFSTLITADKSLYAVYEEVVAPTITINPTLDETTNRTWVCSNSNDTNCGDTVTITSTHVDYELYYKIGDNTAVLYTEPFKVYENTTITAFAKKSDIYSSNTSEEVNNVDSVSPVINTPQTGSTSFDLTISGTVTDSGSGVKKITVYIKEKTALDYDDTHKYESDIFDGVKDQAESYTYTFNNLQDGLEYTLKIVSEDYVGNVTETEIDTETHPYVARVVGKNGMLWYTIDPDTKEIITDPDHEFLYFGSIQEAVDHCATIQCTIQTNPINPVTSESVTIAANQDITIDLDGRIITSNQSATLINNGKLQVVDRNPRETTEHEHTSIGAVKNSVGTAIVNNNIFVLGEGSSEPSQTFIVPEMDRPIIEGKTNGLEQNKEFHFYDGKVVGEVQAILDHGDDAITQYSYNAILSEEDNKHVAILDRTTDPEAKIRSTYYAKLKVNNNLNAFDSSNSGTVTKEEAKLLSKIKQYADYGFVYDAVNDQIYNGNQTTSNTTAISYIKFDLTDDTKDQYITFDTFADTYNSNSYGYVSVGESLANTGTMIYKTTGNDVYGSKFYKLEKGKVYYVYFGFVKGGGDINSYETFKITSLKLFGERQATTDIQMYDDLTPYHFVKQANGSYKSGNSRAGGSNYQYAHSYMAFDLTNETDPVVLAINYDISCRPGYQYGYIYTSNSEDLLTYANAGSNAKKYDGQYSGQVSTINLTPGQVSYIHFVYYKSTDGWLAGDDAFTINYVFLSKGAKSSDLIPTSSINKNNNDTYYFEKVNYDLNTWHDLTNNGNDASLTAVFYDNDNQGLKFSGIGYGSISNPNLNLTDLEETVYLEYSTTSTNTTTALYVGSNTERIGIGRWNNYFFVSNTWGSNYRFPLPAEYADGNKHSIMVSYKSGTYKLYFDGTELTRSNGNNGDYYNATSNIYLGRNRDNGEKFVGNMYGVKVFNKEITPEELDNTENLVLNLDDANSLVPATTPSYQSNNEYVYNSVAHSYLTYDLTNINEDKYLYVNTMISSHSSDVGNVQVTDTIDVPSNQSRGLVVTGEYDNKSIILKLNKNSVNYLHFTYTKSRWDDAGADRLFIKEVKYFNTIEDAYSMSLSDYSKINTYYFDKPVYNSEVDTIELLKDVTINTTIEVPQEKEVVLDLNGFILTSEKNDYIIKNNGKLIITDSEFEERHNANVDYVTEQARLYNEAKAQYLADKAEYEEYAGLCENCEPSDEYIFDHLEDYKDYFGISDVAEEFIFDYVSSSDDKEQTFAVPHSGLYKLEVWGAQGGNAKSYTGGYGGYATGAINLTKDDVLYINVGGQGSGSTATEYIPGGYNGGGTGKGGDCGGTANNRYGASGGGATSIATVSGQIKDLDEENDIDNILIVAGGGGGAVSTVDWYQGAGGSGGGAVGVSGYVNRTDTGFKVYSTGGTQTAGGTGGSNYDETSITPINTGGFGYGGSAPEWETCGQGGAGGGGLYGGGAGVDMSGAGGSGYIGNEELLDKKMVCYNCAISSVDSTKTESTTCNNATPTVDCSKRNSGYAKITLLFNQDVIDDIRNNLPKTYNVKSEPTFVNYLSNIDFDSSIDPNTITPDSEVSFNIDESHVGGITTTLASAILNEQYGILTLKNIAINVNVNSKIGIENRGSLLVSNSTEINANNSGTIGIFNESNGEITFSNSSINANGSSSTGLLNRSSTPTISGVKITSSQTNATGLIDESVANVTYSNFDISGAGMGVRVFNGADATIIGSNIKSDTGYSVYNYGQSRPSKLTISNSNLYGQLYTIKSPKEIIVSGSTLTTVYNLMGNITLNSSTLWSFDNRGEAVVNNSTFNTSDTAISNYATPNAETQYTSRMIINNTIFNSTATSAVTLITNNDKMSAHKVTVNNIKGTKSTAFSNSSPSGSTAYLSIDGDSTIDSSFGTAISNSGVLTIGSDKSNIEEEYKFGYTGGQQEFVAPTTGTYKLETWGASGAETPYGNDQWRFNHGGFGGYASGTIELQEGQKLYIHVGGVGSSGGPNPTAYYGSYNGGGSQTLGIGRRDFTGSGGGATDISLSDEDNTWYYDNGFVTSRRSNSSYEQRILVAGGGSGAGSYEGSANKDGGYSVDPSTSQLGYGSRAGGGGYYGGTAGIGGSSYASSSLTNVVMKTGNVEMPDFDSSGNMKGNLGNGYAKITLIGNTADTVDSNPSINATNYGISGRGRVIYYDGTVNAKTAFNSSIEVVPNDYDIYKSIDSNDNENVVLLPNSSTKPVPTGEEAYVAAIGSVKYTTIQNAVDAASTGDEIDLLVDISQQNTVTIPDGKNLTIDYNGHTVTSYSREALFHNTNTSVDDTNVGTTITDSLNTQTNNYWYGNSYFKNDGKLTISKLKFYSTSISDSTIVNNSKLDLDRVTIYFGYSLTNKVAVINNATGNIIANNCNFNVHNVYGWGVSDEVNNFADNDGTMIIKNSSLVFLKDGNRDGYTYYFLLNNETGKYVLDNITFSTSGNNTYYLLSNDGEVDLINNSNLNTKNITSTGIINLTNNTLTAGTISSTGLVRVNSGTYNNTFNISGAGKQIDASNNLYSFIMNDGLINTTLKLSSTGIADIRSGEISVTSGVAVNNTNDCVINLGVKDGLVDTKANTKPVITGKTFGIYTTSPGLIVNFYDGLVSGQKAYNVTVDDIETGYSIRRDYDSTNDIEEKYLTNEPMFTNVTQSVNYANIDELNTAITNGSINSNDEIQVYRNITITRTENKITIPSSLTLTFDLNGKVVDKNNDLLFEINGTLNIKDSDSNKNGQIDSTHGNIFDNKNTLNILSGEYISERDSIETAVIWNYENATLNISDGKLTKYYDMLLETSQQDRGYGSIINNSGDVNITGGEYIVNSSYRGGYFSGIANHIYTSNVFYNNVSGVINATNMTVDGFASVDVDSTNKNYSSSISCNNCKGQMFTNAGILNIGNSTSSNSLIGDNTGTVVMEDVTMNNIGYINNIYNNVKHKPIVNSGTFTIKGGSYTSAEQLVYNTGTFIITKDSNDDGTTITRTANATERDWAVADNGDTTRFIYNYSGNMEIDNATILCDSINNSYVIRNNSGGYVKVDNSTIKSNNYPAISNGSTGTVEVYNNSTVSSKTTVGIENASSGTVNIGKLKQDDGAVSQTYPLIVGNTYGVKNSSTGILNFYDGLLKGKTAAKTGAITNIEPNYTIIEPSQAVDDYYIAYLDRIYVVENANDSTKKYYSIVEAFADATDGDEFKMIANYSLTSDVSDAVNNNNNITLDLNGYAINQGNDILITNNGTLTIKDDSTNKTGTIRVISGTKCIENTGTLTITGGKITTSTNKLLINNSATGTLTIKDYVELESTGSSVLVDNSGTMNVLNGANMHVHLKNVIVNRNILNVIDLNNDDDSNTSSSLSAPRINSVESGSFPFEGQTTNSAIYSTSGTTTNIYGGIFNNGGTYNSGDPDCGYIIKNEGTATIKNLGSYAMLIGENSGSLTIENSHFYNFKNQALMNSGTVLIKDTVIERTPGTGLGTSYNRIHNYATLTLNNVTVTNRDTGGEGSFIDSTGLVNIIDSNINYSSNDRGYVIISSSTTNVTNTTIITNLSSSISGTINFDSSTLNSSTKGFAGSGTINIKNGSTVTTNGNAIETTGRVNVLDTSKIKSNTGYGILLSGSGTVTMGEIGGVPDQTLPYVEGQSYGIYRTDVQTSSFEFYDGLIVGQTGPNALYGGVTNVEGGYETTDVPVTDPLDGISKHNEYLVVSATSVAIAKVGTYTFSANSTISSSRALQNAINFAIGDGTSIRDVDLVANVDLTSDELSITASNPVTINMNNHTIMTNSTYNLSSNISLNYGGVSGSVSRLLSDVFDLSYNPKDVIIYEMSDGSNLDATKTYKLYKDDKLVGLEREELGKYRYKGDNESLTSIKGRLYINNLSKGSYRLVSSDNKSVEFSIDEDGKITGNVTENTNNSSSSKAISESQAEVILFIQTGINKHYYLLFIIPALLLVFFLIKLRKNTD